MSKPYHMNRYDSITLSGGDYNGMMDDIHNAETERDDARQIARQLHRVAQHLAIMHRRENRVMEGAEGEIARLVKLAGSWLTEEDERAEDAEGE